MTMWQVADAARLAEITPAQLREWTKREIIVPDVLGRGSGHHSLYGWQTVLVIAVIAEMRQRFGIELGRWSSAARSAREALDQISFLRLWDGFFAFRGDGDAELQWTSSGGDYSCLRVALDPHLSRLANEMRLPGAPSQLPLLAPIGRRK